MKLDEDIFGSAGTRSLDPDIFGNAPPPLKVRPTAPKQEYVPEEGFFQTLGIGAGRTFDKLGAGVQQLYYGATGNDAKLQALQADQAEKDSLYAPLQKARPWATGIGESLPAMAIPMGGAATTTAGIAARYGLGNAVLGALQYGSAGERAGNAAVQGIGSAAGAVAGSALGNGVSRLANLQPIQRTATPAQQAAAAVLDKAGVPLSIGERTGSKVARGFEDAFSVLPRTAGTAQATKEAQAVALNRAVAKMAGVNDSALTAITPDVAMSARNAAGKAIGDIAERNVLTVDAPVMQKLIAIQNEVTQFAPDDVAKPVLARVNQALSKLETSPTGDVIMQGRAFRELQSAIGKQMQSAKGDTKAYLGSLRNTLRESMNSSISKADAEAWQAANKAYQNAILMQDVAGRSATGDISPAALFQAAKKGTPEARQLGAAAKALIAPLPSSGTAERSFAINFLNNPLSASVKAAAGIPAVGAQKMLQMAGRHPNGWMPLPDWMLQAPGVMGGYAGGGLLGAGAANLYGQ